MVVRRPCSCWLAYGYYWNDALYIAESFLAPVIDIFNEIIDPFSLNSQAAQDLHPLSTFMNNLNANPSGTLPNVCYAIYGHEDWYSHWRLADAFENGGVETGSGLSNVTGLVSYYSAYSYMAYNEAEFYWFEFLDTGDPDDLDSYYYWNGIYNSFLYGAYALNTLHQEDWNAYMVGEPLTTQNEADRDAVNDAFIPKTSQAPSFITHHLEALHTNHAEETHNSESLAQISYALKRPDINLPLR